MIIRTHKFNFKNPVTVDKNKTIVEYSGHIKDITPTKDSVLFEIDAWGLHPIIVNIKNIQDFNIINYLEQVLGAERLPHPDPLGTKLMVKTDELLSRSDLDLVVEILEAVGSNVEFYIHPKDYFMQIILSVHLYLK